MVGTLSQSNPRQRFECFLLVGHAVKILCEHDVLDGGQVGNQMKLLKDEADLFGAHPREFISVQARDIFVIENNFARAGRIETADQVHQG